MKELQDIEAKKQKAEEETTAAIKAMEAKKAELEALAKEEARVKKSLHDINEERRSNEDSGINRLKQENFEKALSKAATQFGYESADIEKLKNEYKVFDDGSVTEDNILKNLAKAHVALNPSKYLEYESKIKKAEQSGQSFNSDMASMAFAGNQQSENTSNNVILDEIDMEVMRRNGMDVQTYKKLKAEGKIF